MWRWSVSRGCSRRGIELTLTFEAGDVTAIDGEPMSPATVLAHLNSGWRAWCGSLGYC